MANEEQFGRLSPEQINRFAKTMAELPNLTGQQEEIIEKVLQGEADIGELRISYLERYFDSYSKNLDLIARKYSSLDETFLILNDRLAENYKKLSSDITNLEKQLKETAKTDRDTEPSDSSDKENQKAAGSRVKPSNTDKAIQDILQLIKKKGVVLDERQQQTLNNNIRSVQEAVKSLTSAAKNNSSPSLPADLARTEAPSSGASASNVLELQETPRAAYRTEEHPEIGQLNHFESNTTDRGIGADDDTAPTAVSSTVNEDVRTEGLVDTYKNLFESLLQNGRESLIEEDELKKGLAEQNKERITSLINAEDELKKSTLNLAIAKQEAENLDLLAIDKRLTKIKEASDAELATQKYLNNILADIRTASESEPGSTEYVETGISRAQQVNAEDTLKSAQELEAKRIKWIEKQELAAKRKNGGILDKEEAARIQKAAATKFKFDKENLDKITKERNKLEAAKSHAEERSAMRDDLHTMTSAETFEERKQAFYNLTHDEAGNVDAGKAVSAAILAISDLAKKLEGKIDEIATYKGAIDTRLQGSNNETSAGSYWGQLTKDMMSVGAVTPFFKQETFAENIKSLVDRGIAFDLKQRAFLMTIQEKIATTFDVADGTLLRLIRLQQEDSTAGRLGMESALNSFLNEMYENTEYLKDVASSVRSSLQEMEALMDGAAATEVEYQVQKWMGSLYSVGMSSEAVQGIAGALGQLAAGQVEALTGGSGAGNLLVMAANDAGLTISDILTEGLNADETNRLLQATVNYLAEIAESSKDNKVVQQQLAGVFGVKASDLRAATNLASKGTTTDIYGKTLSYDNMLNQLYTMAGSMASRTSIGEMMTNIWENGQYSIASSMANNPVAYLTYKLAGLLDSAVGGIDLPFVNVMGFGVDLNTTVSDLMRIASVGTGLLGSLGPMISGLASSFSGRSMLSKMGIAEGNGLTVTPRGGGQGATDVPGGNASGGAQTTSGSGYVGNGSGSDVKDSTIQEAEDSQKKQMIEAKEEAEENQVDFLNMYVLKIYELLDDVASGKRSLNVKMAGYGLTSSSSGTSLASAQGGVAGLLSNNSANSSGSNSLGGGFGVSESSSSNSGSGSGGLGSSVGFGGWSIK